jgi:hypothetical protein
MPNWCSNYIVITGAKTAIKKIKKDIESINENDEKYTGVFQTLVGIDPSSTQEEYDKGGWYDSNVNYWGTKWDVGVDDSNFVFEDTSITMGPDTAWSPPVGFCTALAKKYKVEVSITYEEPGCNFSGRTLIYKNGDTDDECYSHREGLYYFNKESFWYEVQSDIEWHKDDDDEKSNEEFIEDTYPFVSDKDKKEILKLFKQSVNE